MRWQYQNKKMEMAAKALTDLSNLANKDANPEDVPPQAEGPIVDTVTYTEQEVMQKRADLLLISDYAAHESWTETVGIVIGERDIPAMSPKEVALVLGEVRMAVGRKNAGPISTWGASMFLDITEGVMASYTSVKVRGPKGNLSDLKHSQSWCDTIHEFYLENFRTTFVGPEKRLALMFCNTLWGVHSNNLEAEAAVAKEEQEANNTEASDALLDADANFMGEDEAEEEE